MRKKLVFNEMHFGYYRDLHEWPVNWLPDEYPCLILWEPGLREFGRNGFWMIIYPKDLQDDQTDDNGMSLSGN